MKPPGLAAIVILLHGAPTLGQIVSYDAATGLFPEELGWEHTQFCTPERWIEDAILYEDVDVGECHPPPGGGDRDTYKRDIDDFIGVPEFFVEWRVATTATEPWGGSPGAQLAAGNDGGVTYWFGFAQEEVNHDHDAFQINEFFQISPGLHTYHLRIFNDLAYAIYIDGDLVFEGTPAGPYPDFNPRVIWTTRAWTMDNVTQWPYLRYGVPPIPASGDIDSDGQSDDDDLYFFQECLSTPAGSWPGCQWSDMDEDGDTDCDDWDLFQAAWTGDEPVPLWSACDCPPDLSNDGSIWALDLALVLGAWGPAENNPADLDADDTVGPADLAIVLGAWGPCE